MDAKKRISATLAGFVVYFLLGWLVYGFLLRGFYESNAGAGATLMRSDEEMVWWALIVGNVMQAYLLVYIFGTWAHIHTFSGGFKGGLVIGLIMGFATNLTLFGTMNLSTLTAALVDPVVFGIMMALVGGTIGWVLGRK